MTNKSLNLYGACSLLIKMCLKKIAIKMAKWRQWDACWKEGDPAESTGQLDSFPSRKH
jgi:hypothetical protein